MRSVNLIVIHCSASPNGEWRDIADIDKMHAARGFQRDPKLIGHNAPDYPHIGYHYLVYTSGGVISGRGIEEIGAHVRGHNARSIGVCMVGTDKFTLDQWTSLRKNICATLATLAQYAALPYAPKFPVAPAQALDLARQMGVRICGHRLKISSDNPAYQPFELDLKNQVNEFAIIGRVVWAGRRM